MAFRFFDSNRPFNVKRWPGYYGWTILAFGTLGMIAAVPGSPPGMSVFVDDMIAALDMDRGSFALSYTFGTIMAGLCAPFAGKFVDQWGARLMGCLSFFGLGVILIVTGLLDQIYQLMSPVMGNMPFGLILVFLAFFGIRLMGLSFGMTTCRSMVFRWFEGKRGWAAAINGIMLSLSFSSAPVLLNGMVLSLGWQQTWIQLGILFAFGMTALAYIFFRDSPESCGIEVEQSKERLRTRIPIVREFTAPEAIRTKTFWIFISGLALNGLIGTGISFHIVGMAESYGLARQVAVDVFLPSAIFQITTTLLFGRYSERLKLKHMLGLMVIAQTMTLLGALNFYELSWRWCYIVSSGISWGLFGVLINIPWPRFYGRKHLGAINGWVTGATVVASSVGPYLFGLSFQLTDAFSTAIWLCLGICPIVLLASFVANNPQVKFQAEEPASEDIPN